MNFRGFSWSAGSSALMLILMAYGVDAIAQNEVSRSPGARHEAQAQSKAKAQQQEARPTEKFPAATRKSPNQQASKKGGQALRDIVDLYQAKKYPETLAKVEALLASTDNAYERSFASQIAASAASESGDNTKAEAYFKQAIAANGLDNNDHYIAMYNLAVTQYTGKRYADSLASIERLLSETKTDAPEYLALKGALLANLGRPAEAAALYEQLYTRDPADRRSLMNAVALYQQAKNSQKVDALLAGAKGKGELKDPEEYRALYAGYINAGKLQDAITTIDDGLAKQMIQPSAELVNAYSVIAQTAYGNGDSKMAIAMYGRAAAIAGDGLPSLNLAKVLLNEGRTAEAKRAAQQALDKGLGNPADAKRILAAGGK